MLRLPVISSRPAAPAAPRGARVAGPPARLAGAAGRSLQARSAAAGGKLAPPPPAITLTDAALVHLRKLRDDNGSDRLLLRMGVKSGGCSGMSYVMDFESEENIRPDDAVMEFEGGFKLVCDPKSLLYLFGMQLDYSSELIGGGFRFFNPNASSTCGCGTSFGV